MWLCTLVFMLFLTLKASITLNNCFAICWNALDSTLTNSKGPDQTAPVGPDPDQTADNRSHDRREKNLISNRGNLTLTEPKLHFLCFSHWFSAIYFLLLILANCVRDESCREKLAPISPRGPKFLAQTDFCAIRWRFCNKLNSAQFSKSFIDR